MRFLASPHRNRPGLLATCCFLSASLFTTSAMADKSAGDYFVHSLPGAPEGPLLKMHAGSVLFRSTSVARTANSPG